MECLNAGPAMVSGRCELSYRIPLKGAAEKMIPEGPIYVAKKEKIEMYEMDTDMEFEVKDGVLVPRAY